jgi:hypothetical protein
MKLAGGFYGVIFVIGMSLSGCMADSAENFDIFSVGYDFSDGPYEWKGDFADFKSSDSVKSELNFGFADRPLAVASTTGEKSLMLSGNNQSDNLFMFIKRQVSGLRPNTEYTIVFEVEFASKAISGFAEGDDVYLKVGATTQEPSKLIAGDYYRMNISKGVGNEGGSDMAVIGTIGLPESEYEYNLIEKSNSATSNRAIIAQTNSDGELWLIIGTDSTFKGPTTIYYTAVKVVFSASN